VGTYLNGGGGKKGKDEDGNELSRKRKSGVKNGSSPAGVRQGQKKKGNAFFLTGRGRPPNVNRNWPRKKRKATGQALKTKKEERD